MNKNCNHMTVIMPNTKENEEKKNDVSNLFFFSLYY